MVVDNERCACAVVGRIEVCWMPHGGFCWPRRLIHQLLQFCSRFKHAKKSLGLVPSNKCAGWTSGNMHDKDVSRMPLLSFGSFAPNSNSPDQGPGGTPLASGSQHCPEH